MSYLVENPEERFSRNETHLFTVLSNVKSSVFYNGARPMADH